MPRIWETKQVGCNQYVLYEQDEDVYVKNIGREEIRYYRKDQVPSCQRYRRARYSHDKAMPGCIFLAYSILYRCFRSVSTAEYFAKAAAWKFLYMRVGASGFIVSERQIVDWIRKEYEGRKVFGLQENAVY